MKIKQLLQSIASIAFIFVIQGCGKEKHYRTCTATHGGNIIATQQACNNETEEEFKTFYYYANVSCK